MQTATANKELLFYDGTCGFCHRVIQLSNRWLKTDDNTVRFAALQGATAEQMKAEFVSFPTGLDAIVFYKNHKLYIGAAAFFELAKRFKYPWRFFALFIVVPDFISNFIYDLVAQNRYRLFGRADSCELPDYKFRSRFLD